MLPEAGVARCCCNVGPAFDLAGNAVTLLNRSWTCCAASFSHAAAHLQVFLAKDSRTDRRRRTCCAARVSYLVSFALILLQAMDSEMAEKMTDLQRRLTLAERRLQVRPWGARRGTHSEQAGLGMFWALAGLWKMQGRRLAADAQSRAAAAAAASNHLVLSRVHFFIRSRSARGGQ